MIVLQVDERILVVGRRRGLIASTLEGGVCVKGVRRQGRGRCVRCVRCVVCRLESRRRRRVGRVEGWWGVPILGREPMVMLVMLVLAVVLNSGHGCGWSMSMSMVVMILGILRLIEA